MMMNSTGETSQAHATATLPAALEVTQISTNDIHGGAARAAYRLHRALPNAGVHSRMLVAQRFGRREKDIIELNATAPAPAALGRAVFRFGRRWHRPPVRRAGAFFTFDWSFTGWRLPSQLPRADLVNLHWVADLLDYRTLPTLVQKVPVVWTFHDMNAFTGGCHYSGSCMRYRAVCGACPQLATSDGEGDMTRRVLLRKKEIFDRVEAGRLTVVCPSHWLANETKLSTVLGRFDVRVIPNGIDLNEFVPVDRAEARQRLGLPEDARIVLFVADLVEDERKGLPVLLRAFAEMRAMSNVLLVTLGRGGADLQAGIPARHLGEISDSAVLRAAYSAADVFAIPSRQDNLPNTILESMACGTPVVGFRAGGVGEAVVDGVTGLLAPTGDADALASALRRVIGEPELRRKLADECRARAEREYSVELQAQRYASLYDELCQRARQNAPA